MVRPSGYRDDKGRLGIGMRRERFTAYLWAFFSRQGSFFIVTYSIATPLLFFYNFIVCTLKIE